MGGEKEKEKKKKKKKKEKKKKKKKKKKNNDLSWMQVSVIRSGSRVSVCLEFLLDLKTLNIIQTKILLPYQ